MNDLEALDQATDEFMKVSDSLLAAEPGDTALSMAIKLVLIETFGNGFKAALKHRDAQTLIHPSSQTEGK